jgi:hypothetical protein
MDRVGELGSQGDVRGAMEALKGSPLAQALVNGIGVGSIRAFHGSPYDFARFDLSKIGTGEGNQAYGRGLYFAENPEVAASYKLTQPTGTGPTPIPQNVKDALDTIDRLGYDTRNQALQAIRTSADWRKVYDVASRPEDIVAADAIDRYIKANPRGHMYEVNLNAEPQQFLDWDRPLSQQSPELQSAAADLLGRSPPTATGAQFYHTLSDRLAPDLTMGGRFPAMAGGNFDPQAASEALNVRGVPGVKYLDAGSRAAGDGSRNYVVFDPDIIEIIRKYGLGALSAGAGGAAALNSNDAQAAPPLSSMVQAP